MLSFIRRTFVRDFEPPPAPDVTQLPTFPGQRIVETIYSNSKREQAFITVDDIGDYRVLVQGWDTSDWKAGYGAFGSGQGSSSHTDRLERARELADEALRCSRHDV